MYEHAAVLSGDSMIITGGLFAVDNHHHETIPLTNHRAPKSALKKLHFHSRGRKKIDDSRFLGVVVLDLRTLMWSNLLLDSVLSRHGHSMVSCADCSDEYFVFGGRSTVSMDLITSVKMKKVLSEQIVKPLADVYVLNIAKGTYKAVGVTGVVVPCNRYGQSVVPFYAYSDGDCQPSDKNMVQTQSLSQANQLDTEKNISKNNRQLRSVSHKGKADLFDKAKEKALQSDDGIGVVEVKELLVFGGSMTADGGGYCFPDIYLLTKVLTVNVRQGSNGCGVEDPSSVLSNACPSPGPMKLPKGTKSILTQY